VTGSPGAPKRALKRCSLMPTALLVLLLFSALGLAVSCSPPEMAAPHQVCPEVPSPVCSLQSASATALPEATPSGTPTLQDLSGASRGYSRVEPQEPVVLGTVGTWAITYVVGTEGLAAGSDLCFYLRNRPPWSPMQTTSPDGAGYVLLMAPEPSSVAIRGTGSDDDETYCRVKVTEAFEPGERLTLIYQNARAPDWGAPRRVEFPVCVKGPGDEACVVVPHETYPELVVPWPGRLLAVAPSIVAPGEPFTISVAAVWQVSPDRHYAGTVQVSCSDPQAIVPPPYTFGELDGGTHRIGGVQLAGSGVFTCTVFDTTEGVRAGTTNPIVTDWSGPGNIYFGDPHVHTQLHRDWEINEPDDLDLAYEFARDVTALDFVAITDHGSWMTDDEWQLNTEKAAQYDEPGRFVTFVAYEWEGTSLYPAMVGCPRDQKQYGHRNVYFSGDSGPLIRSRDGCAPSDQRWERLETAMQEGLLGRALTIPHHPSVWPDVQMNWDYFDPQYDRLVEIVQFRGSSEYEPGEKGQPDPASVQAALARGYVLGFVGGSDNHLGQAGVLQGLSAILAPELTRDALFEALYERHTYATTGARMLIDFRGDGHPMGSQYQADAMPLLVGRVVGTASISRLDIVKDNVDVHSLTDVGQDVMFGWEDLEFGGSAFYYLRVTQGDGEMAWTSPIWVEPPSP